MTTEIHPEIKRLNEAGLARVWAMAYEDDRDFLIGSADRADAPAETDRFEARSRLESEIRSLGLGFIPMEGHFVETSRTTGKAENVTEVSYFISGPVSDETGRLLDKIANFIFTAFRQEAVIRKSPEGIMLVSPTGQTANLGRFTPDKVAANYTALVRGSHRGRTFVFERTGSFSISERLARKHFGSMRPVA